MVQRIAHARMNGRGRPPMGEVEWRPGNPKSLDPERQIDRWWARVRFVDGVRRWIDLDPGAPRIDVNGDAGQIQGIRLLRRKIAEEAEAVKKLFRKETAPA